MNPVRRASSRRGGRPSRSPHEKSPRCAQLGVTLGAALLTTAMGGLAWASVPATYGTINGCYARPSGSAGLSSSSGDVRIIGRDASCRSHDTRIT